MIETIFINYERFNGTFGIGCKVRVNSCTFKYMFAKKREPMFVFIFCLSVKGIYEITIKFVSELGKIPEPAV